MAHKWESTPQTATRALPGPTWRTDNVMDGGQVGLQQTMASPPQTDPPLQRALDPPNYRPNPVCFHKAVAMPNSDPELAASPTCPPRCTPGGSRVEPPACAPGRCTPWTAPLWTPGSPSLSTCVRVLPTTSRQRCRDKGLRGPRARNPVASNAWPSDLCRAGVESEDARRTTPSPGSLRLSMEGPRRIFVC